MAAMLRDSAVAAVVVRTRPREIPLATITRENQFMGFLYFPIWVWGSAWRPLGPPELRYYWASFLFSTGKSRLEYLGHYGRIKGLKINTANIMMSTWNWAVSEKVKLMKTTGRSIEICLPRSNSDQERRFRRRRQKPTKKRRNSIQ